MMRIALLVILCHILCLFFYLEKSPKEKKRPASSQLVVKQLTFAETKKAPPSAIQNPISSVNKAIPQKAASDVKKTAPMIPQTPPVKKPSSQTKPLSKTLEKAPVKNQPVQQKKEPVAKTLEKPPIKNQPLQQKEPTAQKNNQKAELQNLLEESLKSLDATKKNRSPSQPSSTPVAQFELASEKIKQQAVYSEKLAAFLANYLQFPEKGSAKVEITLKKNGVVEELRILTCASDKNTNYLKEMLPKVTLPSFSTDSKVEKRTFTLNLTCEKTD